MINGKKLNGFELDPKTCNAEVTDKLPTETGLYLERMRQDVHRHVHQECSWKSTNSEPDDDIEITNGNHPYRDIRRVIPGPLSPYEDWFRK